MCSERAKGREMTNLALSDFITASKERTPLYRVTELSNLGAAMMTTQSVNHFMVLAFFMVNAFLASVLRPVSGFAVCLRGGELFKRGHK